MRAVLFSGTSDGRTLSRLLSERGWEMTVCVATDYGREEQAREPGIRTLTGPLSSEEKLRLLSGADLCIDATHPYATHITSSVKNACAASGTPYVRLLREQSEIRNAVFVSDASGAAAWLAPREGNILLTTGAKELAAFSSLAPERLFVRVIPTHEALSACEALGIPHRNIIAMQGPFSQQLNEALLRQFSIRFLVTKDGGPAGGFPEKAAAARTCGVQLVVLHRPEEDGCSMEEILSRCESLARETMSSGK